MKYFGKKSLSSVLSVLLHISWYIVLVMAILAPLIITGIIVFSTPAGESLLNRPAVSVSETNVLTIGKNDMDIQGKDLQDWNKFKSLPLAVKILILPYVEAILIILLLILKKARGLFTNFKNDIVFDKSNVEIIRGISKLSIVFSIATFSISSLLVSLLLFMLCEIFKNGTALQEEHDLTV